MHVVEQCFFPRHTTFRVVVETQQHFADGRGSAYSSNRQENKGAKIWREAGKLRVKSTWLLMVGKDGVADDEDTSQPTWEKQWA